MLEAVRELLPIVAALYLLDAVAWVRAGRLLAASRLGRRFAFKGPGPRLAGLLPLDRAFDADALPWLATADACWLPEGAPAPAAAFRSESWARFAWEEMPAPAAEGAELRLGEWRLRLASAAGAAALAGLLDEARKLPHRDRERRLAAAAARALDPREVAARRAAFERESRRLQLIAGLQFLVMFALLPGIAWPAPARPALVATLVALAVGHVALVATIARTARRLARAGLGRAEGVLAVAVLSPVAAMRALPTLSRDLLHGCDRLAVAAALLPRAELVRLARAELHGAAHAAGPDPGFARVWAERRERVLALLAGAGVPAAEVLAPPPRRDPDAASWCPVCDAEHAPGVDVCDDCGLPLVAFAQAIPEVRPCRPGVSVTCSSSSPSPPVGSTTRSATAAPGAVS